jgi:hypothetical protein
MWHTKTKTTPPEERFSGVALRLFTLCFNPDWGSRNPGSLLGGQWSFYFELLNLCVLVKQGWIEMEFWKWKFYIYQDYNSYLLED